MRPLDLSLYLVTAPLPHLHGVVAAALAGGVGVVQLRDKTATSGELAEQARLLRAVTAPYGVPLLVDDDVRAAREADGVHVGPDDVHPAEARAALGPEAVVGWSISHPEQLTDLTALESCDYVAVSPVWATGSKPDHTPPWGLDGVRRVVDAVGGRLPVLAIGGIDAGNAASVVDAGAAGVCVISAVCGSEDPRAAAAALREAVRR